MKSERGSITVLAFVTVMFILIILATLFYSTVEKSKAQVIEMGKLSNTLDGDMGEIYKERKSVQGIYVTLYSDGSLIFTNTNKVIDGRGTPTKYGDISNLTYETVDDIPWQSNKSSVSKIEFYDKIMPTTTANWFYGCNNLTTIINISNLDTSKTTNMESMFNSCSNLSSLDLSRFDTSKVTNMNSMFSDCTGLTTLYVGDDWSTTNVISSTNMFLNCTNITGENGTKYNSSIIDKTYARIDTASTPGYFTKR